MEVFKPANLKSKAYRSAIVQKGGIEIGRYIYGMQSERIANSRGTFTKRAIPLSGGCIKGTQKATKPIAIVAGETNLAKGVKRRAEELTKRTTHTSKNKTVAHRPHKKIKHTKKWRGL